MVLVRLIYQRMRFDITVEVITDEIVISVVDDGVDQRGEAVDVTETTALDSFEHLDQVGVEGKRAVSVGVTQVFDVLGQVSEKEDVRVPDFPSDFNLQGFQKVNMRTDVTVRWRERGTRNVHLRSHHHRFL